MNNLLVLTFGIIVGIAFATPVKIFIKVLLSITIWLFVAILRAIQYVQ